MVIMTRSPHSSRTKTIQSLGYLDELEKIYDDPIAHFSALAKEMDVERKKENAAYSFSINKQERLPVFVSTREHIEAHFLTCFIALMLSRILEMKTEHRYSIRRLLDAMVQLNCTYLKENLYLFSYHDEVLELIGEKTGIEFNHRILSLKEIKKILGDTKK